MFEAIEQILLIFSLFVKLDVNTIILIILVETYNRKQPCRGETSTH